MCVSQCPTFSGGTVFTYADNVTQYCVSKCSYPYFAHNDSLSCIEECPVSTNQYGHPIGRVCVSVLNCYNYTTQ